MIERGRAGDAFEVADVEVTALLLCSALHRMFDRIWHREDQVEVDRLRRATHDLFRRAVRSHPA